MSVLVRVSAAEGRRPGSGVEQQAGDPMDLAEEIASLHSWLQDEGPGWSVRPDRGRPADNELGGALDALLVSVPPGGAAALAVVLTTWIRHRRAAISVVVEKDGRRLELHGRDVADVDSFIRSVESLIENGSD